MRARPHKFWRPDQGARNPPGEVGQDGSPEKSAGEKLLPKTSELDAARVNAQVGTLTPGQFRPARSLRLGASRRPLARAFPCQTFRRPLAGRCL